MTLSRDLLTHSILLNTPVHPEKISITFHYRHPETKVEFSQTLDWERFLIGLRLGRLHILDDQSNPSIPLTEFMQNIHSATLTVSSKEAKSTDAPLPYLYTLFREQVKNPIPIVSLIRIEALSSSLYAAWIDYELHQKSSQSEEKIASIEHAYQLARAATKLIYFDSPKAIRRLENDCAEFLSRFKLFEACYPGMPRSTKHQKFNSSDSQHVLLIYSAFEVPSVSIRVSITEVIRYLKRGKPGDYSSTPSVATFVAWLRKTGVTTAPPSTWLTLIQDEKTGDIVSTGRTLIQLVDHDMTDDTDIQIKKLIEVLYQSPGFLQKNRDNRFLPIVCDIDFIAKMNRIFLYMYASVIQQAPSMQSYFHPITQSVLERLQPTRELTDKYYFAFFLFDDGHFHDVPFKTVLMQLENPEINPITRMVRTDDMNRKQQSFMTYSVSPEEGSGMLSGVLIEYIVKVFEENATVSFGVFEKEKDALIALLIEKMNNLPEARKTPATYALALLVIHTLLTNKGFIAFDSLECHDHPEVIRRYHDVVASLGYGQPVNSEAMVKPKKRKKKKKESFAEAVSNAIEAPTTPAVADLPIEHAETKFAVESVASDAAPLHEETVLCQVSTRIEGHPIDCQTDFTLDKEINTDKPQKRRTRTVGMTSDAYQREVATSCVKPARRSVKVNCDPYQNAVASNTDQPLQRDASTEALGFKNQSVQTNFVTLSPSDLHAAHFEMPLGDFLQIVQHNCIPQKIDRMQQLLRRLPMEVFLPEFTGSLMHVIETLQSNIEKIPLSRFYRHASAHLLHSSPEDCAFLEALIQQVFKESYLSLPAEFVAQMRQKQPTRLFASMHSRALPSQSMGQDMQRQEERAIKHWR